ncbi:MAG TPA: hypothetical protein VK822_22715, partial [Acetobacteraceae bacterium]|nr:hypothetical protein [Acetobacteraceae bacterium]
PTPWRRAELNARFDYIFCRHTDFATLDRLLQRLHANKTELLAVLDHPADSNDAVQAYRTEGVHLF